MALKHLGLEGMEQFADAIEAMGIGSGSGSGASDADVLALQTAMTNVQNLHAAGSHDGKSTVAEEITAAIAGKADASDLTSTEGAVAILQALHASGSHNGYATVAEQISAYHDSAKMNEPASEGTVGQVLTTDGNGGRTWTTVAGGGSSLPSGGTNGQVLTLNALGEATWQTPVSGGSGLPTGGNDGNYLQLIDGNPTWAAPKSGAVFTAYFGTDSLASNPDYENPATYNNTIFNGGWGHGTGQLDHFGLTEATRFADIRAAAEKGNHILAKRYSWGDYIYHLSYWDSARAIFFGFYFPFTSGVPTGKRIMIAMVDSANNWYWGTTDL